MRRPSARNLHVMRPVYETAYRTEYHTVLQPVVTCQTQYVDRDVLPIKWC